jgi:hypothetical protein
MLIVALVLAVVGLAALVTAVVTSNELVAWVCIAASVLGVILLIVDAIRERQSRDRVSVAAEAEEPAPAAHTVDETYENFDAEYPDNTDELGAADEPARDLVAGTEVAHTDVADTDVTDTEVAHTEVEPVTEVAESPVATESEVSSVDTESDALPEVHYVTPDDDSNTAMEVRYVTTEEPDTAVEYVGDDDAVEVDDGVDGTKSR